MRFSITQSTNKRYTNYMNIQELKAKAKELAEQNAAKIREAAEIARLQATIELESSQQLFDAKVRIMANGQQTEKLQTLVDECAAIVSSVPVYNAKTRANRVWAGGHRYNYGTQVDLMYQLATGILYASAEHKQLLLAHTGLNLEVLDQLVKAFGTPTYYSRNYHTIVEAKPYNEELLKGTLRVLQSELGVVIDIDQVNSDSLEVEFLRAENTATTSLMQANAAIDEAEFEL